MTAFAQPIRRSGAIVTNNVLLRKTHPLFTYVNPTSTFRQGVTTYVYLQTIGDNYLYQVTSVFGSRRKTFFNNA